MKGLVSAVRRALGGAKASKGCACLACAADRLCEALERQDEAGTKDAPEVHALSAKERE